VPGQMMLAQWHNDEPELAAYLIAQMGIAMRWVNDCSSTVEYAQANLDFAAAGRPKRIAEAYISRCLGVLDALVNRWPSAQQHFEQAVACDPFNATAWCCLGITHLQQRDMISATEPFIRALQLDPDFKAPLVNLCVIYIRKRMFDEVIRLSEYCLQRYPACPHCDYHIALACYHQALILETRAALPPRRAPYLHDVEQLRSRALHHLTKAQDSDEGKRALEQSGAVFGMPPYTTDDCTMMSQLASCRKGVINWGKNCVPLNLHDGIGWTFIGWRR